MGIGCIARLFTFSRLYALYLSLYQVALWLAVVIVVRILFVLIQLWASVCHLSFVNMLCCTKADALAV